MDMTDITKKQEQYKSLGFAVIEDIFDNEEIEVILNEITSANTDNPAFRISNDVFAIRQFFKLIPGTIPYVFSPKMKALVSNMFGEDYFVVKSIYFDKPEKSNWFVAYHQDLTISVESKLNVNGFGPWTVKQDQYAVQPPLSILENNFTIRVHLDDTDDENGALRVIPGSHKKGVIRAAVDGKDEVFCPVKNGAVMFMSPLLLHASNRTLVNKKRRVIHIEFSNQQLPEGLKWSECLNYNVGPE